MEDTLSFEDMATEVEPFEPTYTKEFIQYMKESIAKSKQADAEARRSAAKIIVK